MWLSLRKMKIIWICWIRGSCWIGWNCWMWRVENAFLFVRTHDEWWFKLFAFIVVVFTIWTFVNRNKLGIEMPFLLCHRICARWNRCFHYMICICIHNDKILPCSCHSALCVLNMSGSCLHIQWMHIQMESCSIPFEAFVILISVSKLTCVTFV